MMDELTLENKLSYENGYFYQKREREKKDRIKRFNENNFEMILESEIKKLYEREKNDYNIVRKKC